MEVKEVLKAVGLPENIESVEGIVEAVGKKYVVRELVGDDPDVRGKFMKLFASEHDRVLIKEFGIDKSEAEGKTLKELIRMGATKVNDRVGELEKAAGKGNDEKLTDLQAQLEKASAQLGQYKEANQKLLTEKTELETGFTTKLKDIKLDTAFENTFGKLAFPEGTHDFTKKGFKDAFRSKYKLDLDEKGSLLITDHEGKQILSKTQAGVFLGLDQVLDKEQEEANLKIKNNMSKSQAVFNQQQTFNNNNGNNGNNNATGVKTRTINPRAQQLAEATVKQ